MLFNLFNMEPIVLIARVIALLTAIPFHEAAHAFVSDKLGDSTAKNMGRLTLNPLAHFDPVGALCLLLFGFGWAKPVPVQTFHFRDQKKGMALSAAAGPLSNVLLAFITIILAKIVSYTTMLMSVTGSLSQNIVYVLMTMASINITLAVFNMIPIPPLDGSRIIGLFLPERTYFKIMQYEQYSMIVIMILAVSGFLSRFISFFSNIIFDGLFFITGFVDALFKLLM